MTNPDSPTPGVDHPPWDARNTLYFYGGPLSNFAPTPGLRLPYGYHGHTESDQVAVVKTVEHWFQACKAMSRRECDNILACGTAKGAKHAGRQIELRPDWELVKFDVMVCAERGKFTLEPYRSLLLLTNPRPLAESSPDDFSWGCRDEHGGCNGRNLLGLALMRVRRELHARVLAQLAALQVGH